jgi:hypothetical protein
MKTIDERRAAALRKAVWLRNYQRVRGRALVRLAKQYPDQYKVLFEEERLRDETEGKAWHDITGGRASSVDNTSSPDIGGNPSEQQANRNQQDEGDLGGEE